MHEKVLMTMCFCTSNANNGDVRVREKCTENDNAPYMYCIYIFFEADVWAF